MMLLSTNHRISSFIVKSALICMKGYCTLSKSKVYSTRVNLNNIKISQCISILKNVLRNASSSPENCRSVKDEKNVCPSEPGIWPNGNRTTYKFNPETETALNLHVQTELKAFYYYLSMANYFNRVDVSLPGCRNYFLKMHEEEHQHTLQFINYINMRGGSVTLCPIEAPINQDWKCPLNAFQTALQLEKEVAEKLESVHETAKKYNDSSASDFVITNYIKDQMISINEIAKLVTILSGIGDYALSRYIFDQNLLKSCSKDTTSSNYEHGKCKIHIS